MRKVGAIGSIIGVALSLLAVYSLKPTSNTAFFGFAVRLSYPFIASFFYASGLKI
jgi:hypothetical protein